MKHEMPISKSIRHKTSAIFAWGARIMVVLSLLIHLGSCVNRSQNKPALDLPNIIIIVADDLGWKDVGYHESEINTPVLDMMAGEGVVFNRFYVHSVCSPTRASLLTGRAPSRYGIISPLGDEAGLPKGTVTIAGQLKKNGYETAISGKWHLGAVPDARPLNYGFDSSYGYLRGQIDPYTHLYKNGNRTWHRNDVLIDEEGHATDLITKEAIRIIEKPREKGKPFFLYVAYSVPHYPLDEPVEWIEPYDTIISNKSRRKYAASVSHMDHSIGRILDCLRKNDVGENTVLLFLSDNGGQERWSSESDYNGKFEANDVLGNNLPLRGWKTGPYDGALRVPALLYWPGTLKHQIIDESVNVADLFPTFASLTGSEINDTLSIDGINFWPAIKGEKLPENRVMYWRMKKFTALKKGDWKIIQHNDPAMKDPELFNLALDPYEENSVAAEYPEKCNKLQEYMEQQRRLDPF